MLNHEVSVGCLTTYVGFLLGIGLLTLSALLDADHLIRWGIAVLCLTSTYSLHRALSAHDDRLLQAFQVGRDYERSTLTAVR